MTHKELVKRARKWLFNNQRCGVVFTEWVTHGSEVPDAIGFNSSWTVLVECKANIADFYADRKKRRTYGKITHQIGNYRYYLCPKGLVKVEQIPEKWGLLYCYPKQIRMVKKAKGYFSARVLRKESLLLYSFVRRAFLVGLNQESLKAVERDPISWEFFKFLEKAREKNKEY